ncbi:hypothetical protein [Pseudonocardia pini]|uniref:hypothetical protein n=1 Tax=Pseudonocardia pini TaxID=2758030 RepID=UPI0015F043EC|nr:hypothetical protein [Pseudonocardia pini]
MDPEERREQLTLATNRLAVLDTVVQAQNRYAQVAEVIAAAPDSDAAAAAVADLLGVPPLLGRAVCDLSWRRLAADSRRQALEDRDETAAYVRELTAESGGAGADRDR